MRFGAVFLRFGRFWAHLSRHDLAFMEDQAVEVVGQIGQCQFCLRACNADGANEQAETVLLMGEHMLDLCAHR
jgi:hypothetical protein